MSDIEQLIQEIPKSNLHLHLDGSLRITTLIDLAKKYNVQLPGNTEAELRVKLFKENYASLAEYLQGFLYIGQVLLNPEDFERIAYELAIDSYTEQTTYIEVILAPHLHCHEKMSDKDVVMAVDRGFKKAQAEINAKLAKNAVPFEYGIIIATMRFFNEYFSFYFKRLCFCFPNYPKEKLYAVAAKELAHLTVSLKNEGKALISGFDIVGCEFGYPVEWFKDVFSYLKENLIRIRIHAGEADGPISIYNALGMCYAERIGHGLHLFEKEAYKMKEMKDVDGFINRLVEYIAHTRTAIEVNLTSNSQTSDAYRDLSKHPLRKMLDAGLSVVLSTDNNLVSSTCMIKEFKAAVKYCHVTKAEIVNICRESFAKCFYPKSYKEKEAYLAKVEAKLAELVAKYKI